MGAALNFNPYGLRHTNNDPKTFERKQSASLRNVTGYNLILDTDSYKISHWLQIPEGTQQGFAYLESRGGLFDRILVSGLQYIGQEYLDKPITQAHIDEAEDYISKHMDGRSFNKEGWQYILEQYGGYLPVIIKAVPEGTVVGVKQVIATIMVTDPRAVFLFTYLETMIMRWWAPITTGTKSFHAKQIILAAAEKSSDLPTRNLFKTMRETGVPQGNLFKFHDFGARGGSSYETVSICGSSHLNNFFGSDTLSAIKLDREHYGEQCSGFSIDASEHSTMTIFGPDGEQLQFNRMYDQFKDRYMFACVIDGFDTFKAINEKWGGVLREKVIEMNAILVLRPDSGDPVQMPIDCIIAADKVWGSTLNSKKYKVLNHVRVIQGDGIGIHHLDPILQGTMDAGFSSDNINFGMGGGLIQDQTRDTQKFACKNAWMKIGDVNWNVSKNPITDPGKKSKSGLMTLIETADGELVTVTQLEEEDFWNPENLPGKEVLEIVYDYGVWVKSYTKQEIRERAETYLQF
jgi:nicotinamide phosphoribosyltransferase